MYDFLNDLMMTPRSATKRKHISTQIPAKRKRVSTCNLGFKESILHYLKKSASPKLLLKLMQTSKYFCYKEFPFLIVANLTFNYTKWEYNNGKYELDMENLSNPLWISKELICTSNDNSNIISILLPKVVVCGIKHLHLINQNLTYDEFKCLTDLSDIECVTVIRSQISYYDDKNFVPIDEIIEVFPNLQDFYWSLTPEMASALTFITTKKLVKNLNPLTLKKFCLFNIPETFNFSLFAKFMDANPAIQFQLVFMDTISTKYSNIIQEYVDELIESGSYSSGQILIEFPRQDDEAYDTLEESFYD